MKPIVVTLGDPAGIGPEILAKVLSRGLPTHPLLLVGSAEALRRGAAAADVVLPEPRRLDAPQEGVMLGMVDLGELPPDFRFGAVNSDCGRLAFQAVEVAAGFAMSGEVAAMVTCPINKEAIHQAGYRSDIGHQEILARLTGSKLTATMLMTRGLKVVHLSTHKPLIDAARFVTRDNVLAKLRLVQTTLTGWGLPDPSIAVAALNPHGGEGGLLGKEEIEELQPAVVAARAEGLRVTGPIPADSVFNRAINGEFDVVLALYHDQGHIAIKVHDFHQSTTATLGIPFVRTSVDHGTAFDIAGKGAAEPSGLMAAIGAARALVDRELARL